MNLHWKMSKKPCNFQEIQFKIQSLRMNNNSNSIGTQIRKVELPINQKISITLLHKITKILTMSHPPSNFLWKDSQGEENRKEITKPLLITSISILQHSSKTRVWTIFRASRKNRAKKIETDISNAFTAPRRWDLMRTNTISKKSSNKTWSSTKK
jgi:hypothetical protein